jgi:hypothetical protein
VTFQEVVGLGRSPRTAVVGNGGGWFADQRLEDAPGFLDDILSSEQREVADEGVAKEALVCSGRRADFSDEREI